MKLTNSKLIMILIVSVILLSALFYFLFPDKESFFYAVFITLVISGGGFRLLEAFGLLPSEKQRKEKNPLLDDE